MAYLNGKEVYANITASGTGSGADGKSAYEIAVENGFEGTEEEWLASLEGADGYSPTIAIEDIEGGHRITITDKEGSKSFDVMDGVGGSGGSGDMLASTYDPQGKKQDVFAYADEKVPKSGGTMTGRLLLQNGSGDGALVIGADVGKGTLTQGQRHLGRVAMPSKEDLALPVAILSADTSSDHSSNFGSSKDELDKHNRIEFGGRPGATGATSPDSMGFTVAKTHNATDPEEKMYAFEVSATGAVFNVPINGQVMGTIRTINGIAPDENGNIDLPVFEGEYEEIYAGEYEEVTSNE